MLALPIGSPLCVHHRSDGAARLRRPRRGQRVGRRARSRNGPAPCRRGFHRDRLGAGHDPSGGACRVLRPDPAAWPELRVRHEPLRDVGARAAVCRLHRRSNRCVPLRTVYSQRRPPPLPERPGRRGRLHQPGEGKGRRAASLRDVRRRDHRRGLSHLAPAATKSAFATIASGVFASGCRLATKR